MRRAPAAAVAALVLAAGAAGCGSSGPGESAGSFATRILREELAGKWAAQWAELHPGHQKLISRAQYVVCSESLGTNVAGGGETFAVTATREQALHVRGVSERKATLVTIAVRRGGGAAAGSYRLHAVLDGGHWRWILGGPFLDAVTRGQCLDGSPLGEP